MRYVSLCTHTWFLFQLRPCFVQTMAGWAVVFCFVMVGLEDWVVPGAEGWCQACSLADLAFILSGTWVEWVQLLGGGIFATLVCQVNCEGLFMGGDLGRTTRWKVWEQRQAGGLWLCVRSCRQLFHHRSVFSLPTKILFQSMRGIRAAWCKNKVMGKKQILLSFSGSLELKLTLKVRANKALPMKARNLLIKDYLQRLNFTLCNFYLNGMGLWQPSFWWCPFCSILMPYCK